MFKPKKLKPGDKVAAISLSWGGASAFPLRYQAGKDQFIKEFGVEVIETTHALRDPAWLAKRPEARASDLMESFADDQAILFLETSEQAPPPNAVARTLRSYARSDRLRQRFEIIENAVVD